MDKEQWEEIAEFPDYLVSNLGAVTNIKRGGTELNGRPNQYGHLRVGLVRDGVQYTRGLALIVAEAFVPKPHEHWNTPIHLDGDVANCRADNLMWRPRPIAIRFHRQFWIDDFHINYQVQIVEINTGNKYESVKEACMAHGLYYYDVVKSYVEETFVPLTHEEFRLTGSIVQ